jgi:hypothetical protein
MMGGSKSTQYIRKLNLFGGPKDSEEEKKK